MDSERLFGGKPSNVILRLVLISLVVGFVLTQFNLDVFGVFQQLRDLVQRIYSLGFGAFETAGRYIILGAVVVVPIWLLSRLLGFNRGTGRDGK